MKRKKKILIADDDIHVHKLLTTVLSSDEFDIIHAYDGQEAVERVEDEMPDLIVLDIRCPSRTAGTYVRTSRRIQRQRLSEY